MGLFNFFGSPSPLHPIGGPLHSVESEILVESQILRTSEILRASEIPLYPRQVCLRIPPYPREVSLRIQLHPRNPPGIPADACDPKIIKSLENRIQSGYNEQRNKEPSEGFRSEVEVEVEM